MKKKIMLLLAISLILTLFTCLRHKLRHKHRHCYKCTGSQRKTARCADRPEPRDN